MPTSRDHLQEHHIATADNMAKVQGRSFLAGCPVMDMNPLCLIVAVATVLLVQPAVLTIRMQACTVMEQLLNLLQPNLLQVCLVWFPA